MITKTKLIRVKKETLDFLKKDREHFQETIGGGNWSLNDTIIEYKKILNGLKNGKK